tara:strand:- start:36 stop:356 length:321 start_codon:yes stop_codon:yes gene_type:complete
MWWPRWLNIAYHFLASRFNAIGAFLAPAWRFFMGWSPFGPGAIVVQVGAVTILLSALGKIPWGAGADTAKELVKPAFRWTGIIVGVYLVIVLASIYQGASKKWQRS